MNIKMLNERKTPYVIYYWHLERLLTTFPLFHFFMFYDYVYYTLSLHLFLFILAYLIIRNLFKENSVLLLLMYSFSFSLLALILILITWGFLQCIIIPTVLYYFK